MKRPFLFALFLFLPLGCKPTSDGLKVPTLPWALPKLQRDVGNFSNCQEIVDWGRHKQAQSDAANSIYASYAGSNGMPLSASAPQTNVQESGVDEPDLVKVMDDRIFVARSRTVEVVSTADWRLKQTLSFAHAFNIRLFTDNGKVIVLWASSDGSRASIFKRGTDGAFALEKEHTLVGNLVDARLVDHQVLLVEAIDQGWPTAASVDGEHLYGVACTLVQRPMLDDFSSTITAVHRFDVDSPSTLISAMSVGQVDHIYVTTKNLYVLSNGYSWFGWDPRLINDPTYTNLVIKKFSWTAANGPLFLAAGAVRGYIRSTWAAFEDSETGRFHIATTIPDPQNGQSNRLWSLSPDSDVLNTVAQSEKFGPREDIRAVRYLDGRAYVVTFEKTDPLFVLDLKDDHLLGKVDVDGFSAYLHPLGSNLLLGAGYDAVPESGFSWLSGFQMSLFNMADPTHIQVLGQKTFGGRFSHSEVSTDHHAFHFNAQTQVAALPVVLLEPTQSSDPSTVSNVLQFSGALVFNLKQGLDPLVRLTHSEWIPARCLERMTYGSWWNDALRSGDIRRVVEVEGRTVSISPFGIKVHNCDSNYSTRRSLVFPDADGECDRLNY